MTLGLIQTGGTIKWSMIKLLIDVYPPIFTSINCFFGIFDRICFAYQGFSYIDNSELWPLSCDSIRPLLILF